MGTKYQNEFSEVLNRALGCAFGQACGDALGATVEFHYARTIIRNYPNRLQDMIGGGHHRLNPGQITDDTELALALAQSIVESSGYAVESAAEHYIDWYLTNCPGMGNTTAIAFGGDYDFDKPLFPQISPMTNQRSQANGALMRHSMLGIWGWNKNYEELSRLTILDCLLSHPHNVCQEASDVYTHAIAYAIREGLDSQAVFDEALNWAKIKNYQLIVETLEKSKTDKPLDFNRQMGWVLIALQNAFYHLLHTRDLKEVIVDTSMDGGDTDTNACIAGALVGAVKGFKNLKNDEFTLPKEWIATVINCQSARPSKYWCKGLMEIVAKLCFG